MEIYRSAPQKSSNRAASSLNINYGLSMSLAAWVIRAGMTAPLRIYEAALRLGMEHLQFSAAEMIAWFAEHDIVISMATAQRALVDTRFFQLAKLHKSGKRGRPRKIYTPVKPDAIGKMVDLPMGVTWGAPELAAVDLSSAFRYKLALFGRYMVWNENSTRQQQMEMWGWSKPTLIRLTREVCEITPQISRIASDNINFTAPINGDEVFLHEVSVREARNDRRYWLEVVTHDGEIRKLPCLRHLAADWLPRTLVTICQQMPNHYRVHAAYRDAPAWEQGQLLPY